jgi:hypothetical protein
VDPNPITEFEINLHKGIPEQYQSNMKQTYDPHSCRDYPSSLTNCIAGRDIRAGEELLDNYIFFGGKEHFVQMVLDLRRECSGEAGNVEKYQHGKYEIENTTATTTAHQT